MDHVLQLRDLIEERCGLHFDDGQRASLAASLEARMQQLGLERVDDYYAKLLNAGGTPSAEAEFRQLVNLVTITETCFFRDAAQFRMLREQILPELMQKSPKTVRIWSAGCSSGEEAYSIALTLWEMGAYLAYPDCKFEIVGTDINTAVLEAARTGAYCVRALRNVDGSLLKRHFQQDGGQFVLDEEIRRRVAFEQGNLTQMPMPSTGVQDVVFCKNVAIYFKPDIALRLVQGLHDTIAEGGYLLLGHAESLWQVSDGFELVGHSGAFCYRKGKRALAPVSIASLERGTRRLSPDASSEQYDDCLAAFRAGEWDEAEAGLRALLRSAPTFAPARLLLGGVYAHSGRYDEAADEAESLLKLSDLEARAHLLLGMVASRQHRVDHAMQSLRRALYLDDSLALAHFWLGNLYRDRGDLVRACHEYDSVVRDWDRHTLDLTEEFASDLTVEQIVGFCRDSSHRLQRQGEVAGTWP
ncbi:MAG: tetratricopeptide repeat protein [Vicinamibacterales bacterium]|nr:tetratricopeptide repeat protein [Vicinamibacterales bacterium]